MEFTGFIARETEKAIAFVLRQDANTEAKPLWIPRSKIDALTELDDLSQPIKLAGESITRRCVPVCLDINYEFLKKIGVA